MILKILSRKKISIFMLVVEGHNLTFKNSLGVYYIALCFLFFQSPLTPVSAGGES